jgi:hypothetical protein
MAMMFGRKKRSRRNTRKYRGSLPTQFWVGMILCVVSILILGTVWFVTRLESLTIADVRVFGGETIDREAVRKTVTAELEGEYYRLVPRRFLWTYPEEAVRAKVSAWQRVSGVSLAISEDDTLDVYLEEYLPYALWCVDELSVVLSHPCVFLDISGRAFSVAPPLIGTALLRYHNGKTPTLGETPFLAELLRDTDRFVSELRARFGFDVAVVESVGQDEVSYYLRGGGILKTTLRRSVEDTLDDLTVILASKQFEHIRPGNFAYVDLRFGDKVFVNEQGGLEDEQLNAASEGEAAF